MAAGGARLRSGPKPDPNSLKSARRGLTFTTLPAEGYQGKVPRFPLPDSLPRERAVWRWAWRTPQAAAWATEGEWRADMVAEWVRWKVRAEGPDAPSSFASEALRLRHQIGLTPAGLKECGWVIGAVVAQAEEPEKQAGRTSARDRLRMVEGA